MACFKCFLPKESLVFLLCFVRQPELESATRRMPLVPEEMVRHLAASCTAKPNVDITTTWGLKWRQFGVTCHHIKHGHYGWKCVVETACYHVLSHKTRILPPGICRANTLLSCIITSKGDHYAWQFVVQRLCYHVESYQTWKLRLGICGNTAVVA